jgi:rhodanese-related sulfurtransferase
MSHDKGNEEGRGLIRISLEEAKERYDEGNAVILDVVDPGSYEELDYQIKGAMRIDPREIDEAYTRLTKDRSVLAYCT